MPSERLARGWTLTGGILCLVVAFIVLLGGLFFWGFTATGADGRYGRVAIPGDGVVTLPAGDVDVTFTENLTNQVITVPRLGIGIRAVDGNGYLHLRQVDRDVAAVNGVSHVQIGTVSVPRAGRYAVQISGNDAGLGQQLRFGTARQHSWAAVAAVVVAAVLVVVGVLVIVLNARARRRARRPGGLSTPLDFPEMM